MSDPVSELRTALGAAAAALRGSDAELGSGTRLERPKRAGQGDYATNAAMLLAPALGAPPREIAGRLGDQLASALGATLSGYEVAGPGFLNLALSDDWHRGSLRALLQAGGRFGAGAAPRPERILLEFVSANPTGPIVAASGRHAAYGDSLGRILEFQGHTIEREYYVNDSGSQVLRLGESVRARALGQDPPENGYQGDYVAEVAAQLPGAADDSVDVSELADRAVAAMVEAIKATMVRYGVEFDTYFSERSLHAGSPSTVDRAIEDVRKGGHIYEHDGALWLRTTSFGDDKDRVLVRGGGEPTYFASDVAYMESKRERGFERQILVLGADHHGYIARLKAAFQALGGDPQLLETLIMQLVHLIENDARTKMSKRAGEFVTLNELLDEIGVDATRYFMLQSSHERTLDLNLDLARSQSSENPVYYIQYAHARIASMLTRLGDERVGLAVAAGAEWSSPAGKLHSSERGLIKKLLSLPEEIAEAAERRAPHRIAAFALELAQEFTAFYRDCKVVGAEPEPVESFRIALCVASKTQLALVLGLLGVSAPDSM
ncbi:MAG TPA: arginine--tRNA ligase [Solirubrobacteraceae bacterium]|nr:arginine--tRNA ligase [Solirubrobacteraceae bacterium]